MTDETQQAETIRQLNDQFRQSLQGGRVVITAGIEALGPERLTALINKVRTFNSFSPDNDPHGEHDFGAFDDEGDRFFWKIDYYDRRCEYGSENPADPKQTTRVLTLMLADEY
jgi:Protein of unknown function (DUF3768)